MKFVLLVCLLLSSAKADDSYYWRDNKKIQLTPVVKLSASLRQAKSSGAKTYFYTTSKGTKVGVRDKILVKATNYQMLQAYAKQHALKIVREIGLSLYLLRVPDYNQTLHISNQLSQKSWVVYAHPDFVKKQIPR